MYKSDFNKQLIVKLISKFIIIWFENVHYGPKIVESG